MCGETRRGTNIARRKQSHTNDCTTRFPAFEGNKSLLQFINTKIMGCFARSTFHLHCRGSGYSAANARAFASATASQEDLEAERQTSLKRRQKNEDEVAALLQEAQSAQSASLTLRLQAIFLSWAYFLHLVSDGSLGLTAKTASPARPPRTKATRIRARRRSFRASLPSRRPSRRPQPPARVLQMFRQPVPGQLSRVRDRVLDWATARAQKKDELLFHSLAQPKSSPTVEIEFRVVHQTSRHF